MIRKIKATDKIIKIFLTIAIVLFVGTKLFADTHSKNNVIKLIQTLEEKIDSLKSGGAEIYAGKEISFIEQYLKNAKMELYEEKIDLAYYEVNKGKAYLKLIKAKKDMMEADNNLKNAKAELEEMEKGEQK